MSDNEKQAEDTGQEEQLEEGGQNTAAEGEHEDIHLLLEDARNKADSHWNDLLRTQAEMENLRKRQTRDLENAHKYGMEKFIQEILPVWDSLGMGLNAAKDDSAGIETILEGMDLTLKMFNTAMDKFGLEEIDPVGDEFDPQMHQAMSMLESADAKPNTVLNVFQKGYSLNGRLIRPAMVVVAKAEAGVKADAAKSDAYKDDSEENGSKIDDQA